MFESVTGLLPASAALPPLALLGIETVWGVMLAVLGIGMLIAVHEFGHFIVAKWCGVRVEAFSIGFGPYLLSYRSGHTVYSLSLIPLGGYVKMRGQHDLEMADNRAPDSYLSQSVPKRMAIIVAGVTMNAMFAVVLLFFAYWFGVWSPPSRIAAPAPGTPAYAAGLKNGDRILSVNGRDAKYRRDFLQAVAYADPEKPVHLVVERDGELLEFDVSTSKIEVMKGVFLTSLGVREYKERRRVPVGCRNRTRVVLRIPEDFKDRPAAKAGIRDHDVALTVNGEPVTDVESFQALVREAKEFTVIVVAVDREGEDKPVTVTVIPVQGLDESSPKKWMIGTIIAGVSEVTEVQRGGAAEAAGMRTGDWFHPRVMSKNDSIHLRRYTRSSGEEEEENGEVITLDVQPGALEWTFEEYPIELEQYGLGGALVVRAWKEFGQIFGHTGSTLYGLILGRITPTALSGPLGIMDATARSSKLGIGNWLLFLALISINLAVINMLPIPILDGGHMLFLLIEGVMRRPVPQRMLEYVQMAGLALLLALILFVTRNDIMHMFGI